MRYRQALESIVPVTVNGPPPVLGRSDSMDSHMSEQVVRDFDA